MASISKSLNRERKIQKRLPKINTGNSLPKLQEKKKDLEIERRREEKASLQDST